MVAPLREIPGGCASVRTLALCKTTQFTPQDAGMQTIHFSQSSVESACYQSLVPLLLWN